MIKINLLPFRAARKKENIRQQVSIFTMVLILVFICIGWYHITLKGKIGELQTNVNQTQSELAAYKKKVQQVKKLEKELSILNKKMDVMAVLDLNRKEPVQLLDEMTQVIVPDQMWLTKMHSSAKAVEIEGVATDNQTVADFMVNLEKATLFKNVNLINLAKTTQKKLNLKRFSIRCTKAPIGKTAKAKAKK